jgi:enamine deaminase RidA (YjgF/YER057c/UK114 family)
MKKQILKPKELFDTRFFSHAVAVEGATRLVYVAGQVSYDRDGIVVGKGDMRVQCEQVFASLTHALRAAGAGWGDVVKLNAYLVDMSPDSLNVYREVRARYLDPKQLPASTLVGVQRLVHDELLLEVEAVAAVAGTPKGAKPPRKQARKKKKAR